SAQKETSRSAHVGFYLIDKGLPLLERRSGVRRSAREVFRRALGRFPLAPYAGTIVLITTLLAASLLWSTYTAGTHGAMLLLVGIVSLLSFSYLATAIVNCLASFLAPADALPRMDFSE